MPTFAYRAKNSSGSIVDGSVEAGDVRAAAMKLRDMGLWPVELREQRAGAKGRAVGFSPLWAGVSLRSLALFYRQLATMLQAGMLLGDALDNLGKQKAMGRLPAIALGAADHVRNGGAFSDALARYPHIFPKLQIGLVRAGEASGRLDAMIERIAAYLERELEIRRKFSRVTLYPKIIFVFIVVVAIFVPHVKAIVEGGWPVVWSIIEYEVLPIIFGLLGLWVVIKLLLTIPPARVAWDYVKLNFPVLGSVTRKLAMSRLCTALSVVYSAGMPLSQAAELSSEAAGNEVVRRAVASSAPAVQAGEPLSTLLRQTGQIPELVLGMLATGEKTGNIDLVLDKVTEYYESEAATTLEKFGYLVFVALIVAAAVAVAIIAVNFYTGYFRGLGLG